MKIFVEFAFLACFLLQLSVSEVLVDLPNGQIRGLEITTSDKVFYGFRGIPYAQPPVGDLRFQAPVPAENWNGILDATKDGHDCINKNDQNDNVKSEDCLFINVYTPNFNTTGDAELLPVLFWIYGGAFESGSSTYSMYGPDYLIPEGVVFVSFNYRLGPFGFLSTGDDVIPGNAGLKDQNLALQWTNQNIHLFGGDPNKITIFGESAGSASVMYHLISPKSAGLFRAAIGDSGSAISYWALNRNPSEYAYELYTNIANNNNYVLDSNITSSDLLEILRNETAESIQAANLQITTAQLTVPCVEVEHPDAFVTESSFELLRTGQFNQVPTLMGINSEEYLFFIIGNVEILTITAAGFDLNIEYIIPSDFVVQDNVNKTEVAQAIKSIYLQEDQLFSDNLGAVVQYASDIAFTRSIMKHATLQAAFTDVYFYQFSYHGVLGMMQNISIEGLRGHVGHAEDLPYFFRMIYPHGINTTDLSIFSEQDQLVQKRIVKMWTNFVKYLNPTPEPSELLQNIKWPSLKGEEFQYMDIGEDLQIKNEYPRGNSFSLWSDIFNTYGVQPFYTY